MTNELERQMLESWIESMRHVTAKLRILAGMGPYIFEARLVDSRKEEALGRIKKAIDEGWECIEILDEGISEVEKDD